MIHRTYDTEKVNEVINHPDVYPWVHGTSVGPLDVAPIIQDKRNVFMWGEHGGFIFLVQQPGIYEMHSQVLKGGRGKWTIQAAHESFHYLFTRTDALEIVGRVPKGNIAVGALARILKFQYEFDRPTGWIKDHRPIPVKIYSKTIQNWMRDAPGLEKYGEEFHNALETEYTKMGKLDSFHDYDSNHDRYVGAAVEMMRGGQPFKAVVFYNRWARLAGYREISILKAEPVIIDISESILMLKDNDLKVVSCRSD